MTTSPTDPADSVFGSAAGATGSTGSSDSEYSAVRTATLLTLLIVVAGVSAQMVSLIVLEAAVGLGSLPIASLNIIFQVAMMLAYYLISQRYPAGSGSLDRDGESPGLAWSLTTWMAAYGAVLAFALLVTLLLQPFSGGESESVYQGLIEGPADAVFLLISAAIMAPIVEELVFRKFILDRLLPQVGKFRAVLLSALVFSMIHWLANLQASTADVTTAQGFSTFFLGVLLAYIYLRTRSVVYPIIIHGVHNFVSTISLAALELPEDSILIDLANALVVILILASIVIGLYKLVKYRSILWHRTKVAAVTVSEMTSERAYLFAAGVSLTVLVVLPFLWEVGVAAIGLNFYLDTMLDLLIYIAMGSVIYRSVSASN